MITKCIYLEIVTSHHVTLGPTQPDPPIKRLIYESFSGSPCSLQTNQHFAAFQENSWLK